MDILFLLPLGIQKDIWCAQMPVQSDSVLKREMLAVSYCDSVWEMETNLFSNSFLKQCVFWHGVRRSMIKNIFIQNITQKLVLFWILSCSLRILISIT